MQFHGQKCSTSLNLRQCMFSNRLISLLAKHSYYVGMELDVFEIRRINLGSILAGRGKAAAIAAKTGSAASYLSSVKKGDRRLGDELARRIEAAEQLEKGWLDRMHGELQRAYGSRLSDWILGARKHANMTQEHLGEALNVTKGNISAWEKGRLEPNFDLIKAISRITGYPEPSDQVGERNKITLSAASVHDILDELERRGDSEIAKLFFEYARRKEKGNSA